MSEILHPGYDRLRSQEKPVPLRHLPHIHEMLFTIVPNGVRLDGSKRWQVDVAFEGQRVFQHLYAFGDTEEDALAELLRRMKFK